MIYLGEISIDNYILGAVTLYIDIVRMFLKILELLAKLSKDEKKKKWLQKYTLIKINLLYL